MFVSGFVVHIGWVLVPMIYERSNESLSIGVADIDSGHYAYTRSLTVGRVHLGHECTVVASFTDSHKSG